MSKLSRFISLSIITTALSSCSILPMTHTASNTARLCANDDGSFDTCIDMSPEKESTSVEHKKNNNLHFNMLGEYTEQMAVELERDVYSLQIDEAIAVASFVHLDTSLRNTNALGIQLAESFINELQQIGLPVIDHKLMGVLDINDKGDFAFSRNMSDLYNEINIGYVLTGTMLRNSRGILVNARLIDYKTNVVIASSSKLLPTLLVADLL